MRSSRTMRKDLRESPECGAVAEHLRLLHEPAFGRPYHVTDVVTMADASRIVVTGSVYDELEGLPRTALYEVRDGALRVLTSGAGSAKAVRLAPDGASLAFLSDRAKAEVFQLYLLADGQLGEAWPAPAVSGTVEYLDGLIANGKFCCVRRVELSLTWWRRPLDLRRSALHTDVALVGEPDDANLDRPPPVQPAPGWRAPVGSGLPTAGASGRARRRPARPDADRGGGR